VKIGILSIKAYDPIFSGGDMIDIPIGTFKNKDQRPCSGTGGKCVLVAT
jgi:hypothetical protein